MRRVIVAVSAFALALFGGGSAWADPAATARANAYGADVGGSLLGNLIERTPEVESVLPPGGQQVDDILPIDADPVTVSITGRVVADTQVESTIQPFELLDNPGPNNAQGLAEIENLDVLLEGAEVVDPVGELVTPALVSADAVFAEAVGACQGTTPLYSTDSDVINLQIGGEEVELVDGVVDGVIGLVNDVGELLPDALQIQIATDQAGDTADGGRFVNALRITVGETTIDPTQDGDSLLSILDPGQLLGSLGVSSAAASPAIAEAGAEEETFAIAQVDGDGPLIDVTLAHAEVGGLTCPGGDGPDGPDGPPECSDGIDNDGDGVIDFPADPGCDSPEDDDERNECVDGVDNDGDGLIDFGSDPGCESPQDDDERDGAGARTRQLPRTGGPAVPPLLGLGLLGLAGAAEALRRRAVSG